MTLGRRTRGKGSVVEDVRVIGSPLLSARDASTYPRWVSLDVVEDSEDGIDDQRGDCDRD